MCAGFLQERNGAIIRAEGESEAARLVSEATRQSGPAFMDLRRIEVGMAGWVQELHITQLNASGLFMSSVGHSCSSCCSNAIQPKCFVQERTLCCLYRIVRN